MPTVRRVTEGSFAKLFSRSNDERQVARILGELVSVEEPNDPKLLQLLLSYCHPHVVWDTRFGLPDGQLYHGRNGVARFFRQWMRTWDDWSWTPYDSFGTRDGVVVLVRVRASRSGVRVHHNHAQQWVLEGGKLLSWQVFADFKDFAREDGALREAPEGVPSPALGGQLQEAS